ARVDLDASRKSATQACGFTSRPTAPMCDSLTYHHLTARTASARGRENVDTTTRSELPTEVDAPAGERYLLLADISGYTRFMSGVEEEHGFDFSAGIPAAY